MAGGSNAIARVRAGGTHRNTLVTTWRVHVTGIEFLKRYMMHWNGNNLNGVGGKGSGVVVYPKIPENFKGWGMGDYLMGWNWEGSNKPNLPACYSRQQPIPMKVRLSSSHAVPTARTFTLRVEPTVANGPATPLAAGEVKVNWPAGSKEQTVEITTGGKLPDEISRYDLTLTWSVRDLSISTSSGSQAAGAGGVINRTRHEIYSIYDDPFDPAVSKSTGKKWYFDTGLTKQRLDKLLQVMGGKHHRNPTPAGTDVDHLIWLVHQHVNDSAPPYFNGARALEVQYGQSGPKLALIDQWVMWLASRTWNRPPKEQPHWNFGACITYVQLMKTMLAMAGINSQRAWVYPKTTQWPNGMSVDWDDSDLVDVEDVDRGNPDDLDQYKSRETKPQEWPFLDNHGNEHTATVRLIDRPGPHGEINFEFFEGCLYYGGKLVPGAIPTRRYPDDVQKNQLGFANATELLRWWVSVDHGGFKRFMAWVSDSPRGFFDKNGKFYSSPYDIPELLQLPVP